MPPETREAFEVRQQFDDATIVKNPDLMRLAMSVVRDWQIVHCMDLPRGDEADLERRIWNALGAIRRETKEEERCHHLKG